MKIKDRNSFNMGLAYSAWLIKNRGIEMLDGLKGIEALDAVFMKQLCRDLSVNLEEYSGDIVTHINMGLEVLEFDN